MYNHLNVNDCVPKFTLLTKYIVYSPQYLTNLMHKIVPFFLFSLNY